MGCESLTEFSINQSIIIYFTVHKCMPKNFQDYLGNKVTFLKWEDNGLLLANFIEFFCRVLIRHYCNKFRKLIAKYSNDSKDHKGYKPKRILPFAFCDAFLSEILTAMMVIKLSVTSWHGTDEARMNSLGRRVNLKLISCCLPALYTQLDFKSCKLPWQKGNRYRDLKLLKAKKGLKTNMDK